VTWDAVIRDSRDEKCLILYLHVIGCSKPNIFAFGQLVHQKKILKRISLFGPFVWVGKFDILETSLNKPKSPCSKNIQCQFKMHSGKWFMKIFSNIFAIYINLYKSMSPWDGATFVFMTLGTCSGISFSKGRFIPNINALVPVVCEMNVFQIPCCSLFLGPERGHPLDLCKIESPFPKDSSYQIVKINLVAFESVRFKSISLYKTM